MHKRIFFTGSISLVVILAILNFTNPSDAGPLGILFLFLMIYLLGFSVAAFFISLYRKMSQGKENTEKRDYFYAVVIGFGPIILLLMRAFGVLNIWTVFSAIFFVFLGCFLVKNRFSVVK